RTQRNPAVPFSAAQSAAYLTKAPDDRSFPSPTAGSRRARRADRALQPAGSPPDVRSGRPVRGSRPGAGYDAVVVSDAPTTRRSPSSRLQRVDSATSESRRCGPYKGGSHEDRHRARPLGRVPSTLNSYLRERDQ